MLFTLVIRRHAGDIYHPGLGALLGGDRAAAGTVIVSVIMIMSVTVSVIA